MNNEVNKTILDIKQTVYWSLIDTIWTLLDSNSDNIGIKYTRHIIPILMINNISTPIDTTIGPIHQNIQRNIFNPPPIN